MMTLNLVIQMTFKTGNSMMTLNLVIQMTFKDDLEW